MKMPKPFTHYRHYDEQLQPFADENTVPLYDKQALIDLLEEAAKECEEIERKTTRQPPMVGQGCQACAAAIRKLKETL